MKPLQGIILLAGILALPSTHSAEKPAGNPAADVNKPAGAAIPGGEAAKPTEAGWKNGEVRKVWFVHFPERGSLKEPNGLAVRVDRETGECERAVLE